MSIMTDFILDIFEERSKDQEEFKESFLCIENTETKKVDTFTTTTDYETTRFGMKY